MMELSQADWTKAETIARELAMDTDRNELGKIVTYARRRPDTEKILALVEALPRSGYVRSGRTRSYLTRIAAVLRRELSGVSDGQTALHILAWAFRLMTIYQTRQGTRRAAGRKKRRR